MSMEQIDRETLPALYVLLNRKGFNDDPHSMDGEKYQQCIWDIQDVDPEKAFYNMGEDEETGEVIVPLPADFEGVNYGGGELARCRAVNVDATWLVGKPWIDIVLFSTTDLQTFINTVPNFSFWTLDHNVSYIRSET